MILKEVLFFFFLFLACFVCFAYFYPTMIKNKQEPALIEVF